ncbi:MAG: hypothetical protein U0694_21460 [Anaerolineae bacterium]
MDDFVMVIIVLLAFLVVPGMCWVYLRRRGQKTWAMLTLISTLCAIGWLVGPIGVLIARGKPIVEKTACPNCGEHKVALREAVIEQSTGKELKHPSGYGGIIGAFMIFSALMVATSPDTMAFTYVSPVVGYILGFVVGPLFVIQAIWEEYKYRHIPKVHVFNYKCRACQHTWEEHEVSKTVTPPKTVG